MLASFVELWLVVLLWIVGKSAVPWGNVLQKCFRCS